MSDEQRIPLITSLGPILVTKAELAKALMVSTKEPLVIGSTMV